MKSILSMIMMLTSLSALSQSFSVDPNNTDPQVVDTGFIILGGADGIITQNTDPATITALNSVSCNAGGLHTDNSYMRRFDLDGDHGITTDYNVASVDVGIETATGAGGTQPIEIRLYSIANADAMLFANLTPVGSVATTVADAAAVIQNFAVAGTVNGSTDDLVVEVFTPNGQTDGHSFFMGSNNAGQIGPSFLAAADCGVAEPTDTAAIGFPNMQIVMTVNGTVVVLPPAMVPTTSIYGLLLLLLALVFFSRKAIKARL